MTQTASVPTPPPASRPAAVRLPLWKKFVFAGVMSLLLFLGLETAVRVGAYFAYNRSPYFLYYGFRTHAAEDNPDGHSVALDGYSKFPASRQLHQYGMFEKPTPIRINSLGLRGPDFTPAKPPDVYRIICMGESSTFGFFDRDEFTYPALLGQFFAERGGANGKRVEAINAGIPHANSDHILAMMKGELVGYQPDVVTVYAGFNDAVLMMDETWLQSTLRWLHGHVATYVALKRAITALGGPALHSRWAGYLSNVEPAAARRQVDLHVERYERNLRQMVELAGKNGTKIVFIRQPVTTEFYDKASDWRTRPYTERVSRVRSAFNGGRTLTNLEVQLLVHAALVDTMDRLAVELTVPVVDNIAIMDRHPEYYASYVHITEEGNRELAAALHQAIASLQ